MVLQRSKEIEYCIIKKPPRTRKVRNLETNEIFCTIKSAGQKYGVSNDAIINSIKRNRKSSGYHWEYV